MQKIIYIDGIFLENLVMDLLLVRLTCVTLKKNVTFPHILAGSLIGAAGYCLVLCLPGPSYPLKVVLGMIPVAMGMIRIGCATKGAWELLYGTGYLFVYSFLLGGFMLFLMSRLSLFGIAGNSLPAILLTGALGFEICMWGIRRYRKIRENHFFQVELEGDEERIRIYALMDTGNGLVEPVSGRPVAILEEQVWNRMKRAKRPEKYRVIPFHSIGKKNGILEGYEVEKIRIKYGMGVKELTHVLIAVSKEKLSSEGEYQMILPPEFRDMDRKEKEYGF